MIKSLSLLTDKLDSNSATCSALGRLRLSFLICKWGEQPVPGSCEEEGQHIYKGLA